MTTLTTTPRDAAEAAVLGAVLMAEPVIDTLLDERLRPDHFRRAQHAALYAAMTQLRDAGQSIDALTLKAKFDSPQSPVTPVDIDLLAVAVPNLGNVRDYCRIIREGAWLDRAAAALYDASDALNRQDRDGILTALAGLDHDDETAEQQDTASEFLEWYEADRKGWPLPFGQLTEAIGGGMFPGEPTVIGGWSGMGKSFLLSQILRTCRKAGATVHEYANEMHGPKRTARLITSMTGIPGGLIERRKLNEQQQNDMHAALQSLPYATTSTAGWRVEEYCRSIRRNKWDVAAIDTVTNLPCSRVDEWDRACVMLADAAAQAGTHLILICQLNLERDKGKKPPPVGRDLRNTGAWYHRARVVMFVHRDQEALQAGDGAQIWRETSDGHVRLEKATHGDASKGYVAVTFNPKWLRFDELDNYRYPTEAAA
jgi:replicative DNA helicase